MQSEALFARAQRVVPGGVHSPVRAFKAVGGQPRYLVAGLGAYVEDADGQRYVDYVGSFGSAILGHAHPEVVEATQSAVGQGLGFSAPHPASVELAELLCGVFPAMDQVRFVNSGTEATQTAIRLARGATGRDKIIKFSGCYHGHVDALLVQSGSGGLTLGQPDSAGIPEVVAKDTWVVPFNDLAAVEACFKQDGEQIAAIIVEPVAGNMGCILPQASFLQGLRDLCDRFGALLIFDEVMTGFRVAWGGAQLLFDIEPDLTALGKVIGGGLPVGALGGRAQWMQHLAPQGPVYQAGTLSGNPLTMVAGLTTLKILARDHSVYVKMADYAKDLMAQFAALAKQAGVPMQTCSVGAMMGCFFAKEAVHCLSDVMGSRVDWFPSFFQSMLASGIYWPPSAYEAAFIGLAHDEATFSKTLAAMQTAMAVLQPSVKE